MEVSMIMGINRIKVALMAVMLILGIGVSMAQEVTVVDSGTSSGTGYYVTNRKTGCAGGIKDKNATKSVASSVNWSLTSDGTLTISKGTKVTSAIVLEDGTKGTVDVYPMPNYSSSTLPPWYQYASSVKRVVVEDGVTSIGAYFLYDKFVNVTEVDLPNTIEWIGSESFRGCVALNKINIPDNVYAIGSGAFYNAKAITTFAFPKNLKRIEGTVLYGLVALESLTIPEGVLYIDGNYPFYACKKLTEIKLPESLLTIGDVVFQSCTGLAKITIPKNVTTISSNPFRGCTNLEIEVAADNQYYTAEDNVLYSKNKTELVAYVPKTGRSTTFTVPSTVKVIKSRAFIESKVATVTIPEGLTTIENLAFYGCANLGSVTLPASLTDYGDGAFTSCKRIDLKISPENKNFDIDEHGVLFVKGINGRTLILYPTSKTDEEYTVPSDVQAIRTRAFSGNASLKRLILSEVKNLNSIGNYVFSGCTELESVEIPNTVTGLGSEIFNGCKRLNSVVLPDNNSITSIGSKMFLSCESLTSITIPEKVTSIGSHAFQGCVKLESIELPKNVETIGLNAFYKCTGLKSIVIPEKVKKIEALTFMGCTSLKTVEFGTNIASFGMQAMDDCVALESVTIKNPTPPSITSDVFESGLESVALYVPCEAVDSYYKKQYYKKTFDIEAIKGKVFVDLVVRTSDETLGTVSILSGPECGQTPEILATPATGCRFVSWTKSGSDVEIEEMSYKMPSQMTQDETWTAHFEKNYYYINNETDDDNGKLTPSKSKEYYGGEILLIVEAFKGYELDKLTVKDENGDDVAVSDDLKFSMPASDVTIKATFKKINYNVTIAASEHGTVTAPETATYKTKVKLTVSPDKGYKLAAVAITGTTNAVYNETESEFTMPANDVLVTPTFVAIDYTVPVGGTFVVGDFLYKVTGLKPNEVSVSAKDDEVSGDVEILTQVTYNEVTYAVSSIAAEGFAGAGDLASVTIDRTTPLLLGANAFNSATKIKVPCGLKNEYVAYGYPKSALENISGYGYEISVTTDGNGKAEVVRQADCDNHDAKIKAVANVGYRFSKWSDNSTDSEREVTVESNVTMKAFFAVNSYAVNKATAKNGSFEVSTDKAEFGSTVTITPKADEGYKVSSVVVTDANDENVSVSASNTFTMPASEVTVNVTFVGIDYTISIGKMSNGEISVESNTSTVGSDVVLKVTPNAGYELETLEVKDASGKSIEVDKLTFTMPASNVTVGAKFKKSVYNISITETANGTVSLSKNSGSINDEIVITATPKDGHYGVAAIEVKDTDGKVIGTTDKFTMPASDVVVTVAFEKEKEMIEGDTFTIGNYTYTIISVSNSMVSVAASNNNIGESIVVNTTITYNNVTYSISKVTDGGFAGCADLKVVSLKSDEPLTLGANAFGGDDLTLNVPCNAKNKYNTEEYGQYFSSIEELYDGPKLSVRSSDTNSGTAEVAVQQDCGQNAIARAIPKKGYEFLHWSDGSIEKEYILESSLTEDLELVATFGIVEYNIKVVVTTNTEGLVTGAATIANKAVYNKEMELETNASTGYRLRSVTVNTTKGEQVVYSEGKFTMPDCDVTIEVEFEAIDYDIHVAEVAGGHITVGKDKGNVNDRIMVEAVADEGYMVKSGEELTVTSEGQTLPITNGQFTMPANEVYVSVGFEAIDYTITVVETTGGEVVVQSNANVGETVDVEVIAEDGYVIDEPLEVMCGDKEIAVADGQFVMPAGNVVITISFKENVVTEIGNRNVDSDGMFKAAGMKNAISIEVDEVSKLAVFDMSGRLVWHQDGAMGRYVIDAVQGMYVVTNGAEAKKVRVK